MTLKRKIQLARELAEASPEDRADVFELLKDKLPKAVKAVKTRKRRAKKTAEVEPEPEDGAAPVVQEIEGPKTTVRRRGPNKPKVAEQGTAEQKAEASVDEVPVESDEDIVKKVLEGGI